MGAIKEQLSDLLALPKEIVLNLPQITLIGHREISIENYKNIIEFTAEKIRINTTSGILHVTGRGLMLKQLTSEQLIVAGGITELKYLEV